MHVHRNVRINGRRPIEVFSQSTTNLVDWYVLENERDTEGEALVEPGLLQRYKAYCNDIPGAPDPLPLPAGRSYKADQEAYTASSSALLSLDSQLFYTGTAKRFTFKKLASHIYQGHIAARVRSPFEVVEGKRRYVSWLAKPFRKMSTYRRKHVASSDKGAEGDLMVTHEQANGHESKALDLGSADERPHRWYIHDSQEDPSVVYRYPLPWMDFNDAFINKSPRNAAFLLCTTATAKLRVRRTLRPREILKEDDPPYKAEAVFSVSILDTFLYEPGRGLGDPCPVITLEDSRGKWAPPHV